MELKCEHEYCQQTFYWSGRGKRPHLCIPHRIELNRQKSIIWHHTHYRQAGATLSPESPDPESIKRPLKSHLFSGPGLFEQTETLFNHALFAKARSLNKPIDYVRKEWIYGQAGREFMKSFLHPDQY